MTPKNPFVERSFYLYYDISFYILIKDAFYLIKMNAQVSRNVIISSRLR